MKWEYMIVLGATLFFPLILSFDRRLTIWKQVSSLTQSALLVGMLFILWDILVTMRGHWSFNEEYVIGIELLGLPIEEWMFFPVITFVSVFTWEAMKIVMRKRK